MSNPPGDVGDMIRTGYNRLATGEAGDAGGWQALPGDLPSKRDPHAVDEAIFLPTDNDPAYFGEAPTGDAMGESLASSGDGGESLATPGETGLGDGDMATPGDDGDSTLMPGDDGDMGETMASPGDTGDDGDAGGNGARAGNARVLVLPLCAPAPPRKNGRRIGAVVAQPWDGEAGLDGYMRLGLAVFHRAMVDGARGDHSAIRWLRGDAAALTLEAVGIDGDRGAILADLLESGELALQDSEVTWRTQRPHFVLRGEVLRP